MAAILRRLDAHLEACRLDSVFYVGLVGLAGALVAGDHHSGWRLFGAWAAPTLGWLASLYGGDFFDRDLDAIAKPHRPIPSGRMRAREAFAGMIVNIVLGLAIAVALNPLNVIIVLAAVVLGVLYSKVLKRRGILGNLVRGAPTALAFVLGMSAASPAPPLALLPIGLVFWLHDSASNLVGALCDVDGDRRGGYQTFPVRHGDSATLRVLAILNLAWLALAVGYPFAIASRADLAASAPFLGAATVLLAAAMLILVRGPRPVARLTGLRAHEVLVLERLLLASAFVALGGGAWLALALLLPSMLVTLVARSLMRQRYEPGPAQRPAGLQAWRAPISGARR